MYIYTLELTPSKKFDNIDYTQYKDIFSEACLYINKGLFFTRDKKELSILELNRESLIVKLSSKNSLQNPARSISALTRFLTTNYTDIFKGYVYNKTLFSMRLISSDNISTDDTYEISDEELLKVLIDLLYAYTAKSVSDTQRRKKTIDQIKTLIKPYL